MLKTPCLSCLNLSGESDKYICGANKEGLDNDLVNGVDVSRLPDCPFFVDKTIYTARPRSVKRWANTDYPVYGELDGIPIGTEASKIEILTIVRDFYHRRNKWPTQKQIYLKSELKSLGDIWNILNAMTRDGLLIKTTDSTYLERFVYQIPFSVPVAIPI